MTNSDQEPAERHHRPQDQGAACQGLGGNHAAKTHDPVVGPDAGPTLRADADVRPGGCFNIIFRLQNGDEHNPTGVYREVVPEKKLVFTWEWPGSRERESLVTFLLKPSDGGTELTLIHEHLPDEEARISHALGWNGLLDKLSAFLGDIA
jgi:uncharacterized protein YndB with AHSA1/START domain